VRALDPEAVQDGERVGSEVRERERPLVEERRAPVVAVTSRRP
jgi:hypothetical protein